MILIQQEVLSYTGLKPGISGVRTMLVCSVWQFVTVLGKKILTKVTKIFNGFCDHYEKYNFHVKTDMAPFWDTFGLLLISASGHTGSSQ